MRKFVMSLVMMLFMAGLVCAVEATLVKGDAEKKEVTVKEGDKETTYKYTDKLKVTLIVDKDGNTKEGKLSDFARRFKGKGKGKGKGGAKLDITVKDDTITEVKFRAGGKKKN
jgi:hypothetical protein